MFANVKVPDGAGQQVRREEDRVRGRQLACAAHPGHIWGIDSISEGHSVGERGEEIPNAVARR